jgi:tetratricopeptide (TPR) repeat protein
LINLGLALLAAAVGAAVCALGFHLGAWATALPALALFVGTYLLLSRWISQRVQALMVNVQQDIQAGRVEKAISALRACFPLARWQFLLASQIHANLGMLLYVRKDFDGALPHLQKAFFRDWMAHATLGALYCLRNQPGPMEKAFERSVSVGKKEGLAWSAYAYAWQKLGEREKAQAVLARAVEANPTDDRLKSNLTALQNKKKMKMRSYEPAWYQFHLERLPPELSGGKRVVWQRR